MTDDGRRDQYGVHDLRVAIFGTRAGRHRGAPGGVAARCAAVQMIASMVLDVGHVETSQPTKSYWPVHNGTGPYNVADNMSPGRADVASTASIIARASDAAGRYFVLF